MTIERSSHHNGALIALRAQRRKETASTASTKQTIAIAITFGPWSTYKSSDESVLTFKTMRLEDYRFAEGGSSMKSMQEEQQNERQLRRVDR